MSCQKGLAFNEQWQACYTFYFLPTRAGYAGAVVSPMTPLNLLHIVATFCLHRKLCIGSSFVSSFHSVWSAQPQSQIHMTQLTVTRMRFAPSAAASTAAAELVVMRPTNPLLPPESMRLATTTGTPALFCTHGPCTCQAGITMLQPTPCCPFT